MARISSQEAVEKIGNRYDLVLIATQRVRELKRGHMPLVKTNHKEVVTALTEIEEGKIGREYLAKVRKK